MILVIISLFLIVLTFLWTVYLAYRRKIHPLGMPLLASAIFLFIYFIQPLFLILNKKIYYYLNNQQIAFSVFISVIMYVIFIKGWFDGSKNFNRRIMNKKRNFFTKISWNYKKIYKIGFLISLLGTILFYFFIQLSGGIFVFYSMPHGIAGAWKETTAYVYLSRYWIYPGLSLMLITLIRRKFPFIYWIPFIFFVLLALIHILLVGSRGMFFPLVATLTLTYYFSGGKVPKTRNVIFGGIVIGIFIILLVGYRDYIYLGPKTKPPKSFNQAILSMIDVSESAILARNTGGREFLYHAGLIETVLKTNKYHYGLSWIYAVTIHLIPRVIWRNKPYGINVGVNANNMYYILGWTRSSGAAPGIIADIFSHFGIFSIFFFYFLGRLSGKLFKNLISENNPQNILIYVLWYSWGMHLFGQGFGAVIVPYLYTLIPSIFLLRFARMKLKYIPRRVIYEH